MASLWEKFLVISVACFVICVLLFTYRLFFHPLARVPGPLSMKLTGWAHFNLTTTGRKPYAFHELHERYGPVVRIAPNLISVNSAVALNDVYGDRNAPVIKGTWYEGPFAAEGVRSSFTLRDKSLHSARRRLMAHAFSEKSLRDFEPFVSQDVDKWLDQLGSGQVSKSTWTEPKNVAIWISYLTFDILTDLCYGRSFDLLMKNDMRFVAGLIPKMTKMVYELGYQPLRPFLSLLIFKTPLGDILGGQTVQDANRLISTSRQFLDERRSIETGSSDSNATDRKDFFHYLFKGKDPETGATLDNNNLSAESNNLLIAGADTTSATLAACIFYLVRNPTKLKRLRQELEENFSSLGDIKYHGTALSTLPYLRGVINESLRQTPPVGGALHRQILEPGMTIDGTFYPTGVEVFVPHYALMHNEGYYPDPYSFKPERWIVDQKAGYTKEMVDKAQSAFCPFSIGPRGCIGKNLAYMELSLAVSRLVWRFKMEEVKGWEKTLRQNHDLVNSKGEYCGEDVFVCKNDGPLVRFQERVS